MAAPAKAPNAPPPLAPGVFGNLRFDAAAGSLVFLIAMPLCLAIARAGGYPPTAGIRTAVIGGVVTPLPSNSQLAIKGPAVGLIVIAVGAVADLGAEFATPDMSDADKADLGYKLAPGVRVTAGVIRNLFGLALAGRLVDFFPLTPVHGMLASIGLIVIARQAYEVVGAAPEKGAGPLRLYAALPAELPGLNPEVAAIGAVGLLILFGRPLLAGRLPWLRRVPAPLVALLVAVGLGPAYAFDPAREHKDLFPTHPADGRLENDAYAVGPKFLVTIRDVKADPAAAFTPLSARRAGRPGEPVPTTAG